MVQGTEVRNIFDLFRGVAGCLDIIQALYDAYGEKSGGLQIKGLVEALPGLGWRRRSPNSVERGLHFLQHKGWVEEGPDEVWKLLHENVLLMDVINAMVRTTVHNMELGRPAASDVNPTTAGGE